jgi:hypothetical protein
MGATLARPVTASNGVVIMGTGAPLEEEQISYLIRHGVEAVTIEEPDSRDLDAIAREQAQAQERIDTIFCGSPFAPAMAALKQSVLAYRREVLA